MIFKLRAIQPHAVYVIPLFILITFLSTWSLFIAVNQLTLLNVNVLIIGLSFFIVGLWLYRKFRIILPSLCLMALSSLLIFSQIIALIQTHSA